MSAHRYWQIGTIQNSNGSQPALAEANLRSTIGGSNLAVTSITASNTATGAASNLIDGNAATQWQAAAYAADLTYDMGSAVDVVQVMMQAASVAANFYRAEYFILRYADSAGGPFTDVQTFFGSVGWSEGEIRTFNVSGGTPPPPAGTATTVTVTLKNLAGTVAASLSGLKWALHDQITPDLFVTPTAKGQAGTTDAQGVFTVTITGTALTVGAVGWLYVTDSTGATSHALKAFCGPATVA